MVSLPPPLTQRCLVGLRFHQENFGGKATLIKGRWERFVVVSGFQGQSSHSFQSVSTVLPEGVAEFRLKLPCQFSEKLCPLFRGKIASS